MSKPTFDKKTEYDIYTKFLNGKTKREISREYGVRTSVIFNVIRRCSEDF